jgi:hypothetical protein
MIGWQVNDDEYTRTNIHVLSGIRTHSLSVQTIKAYTSHDMFIIGLSEEQASMSKGIQRRQTVYTYDLGKVFYCV